MVMLAATTEEKSPGVGMSRRGSREATPRELPEQGDIWLPSPQQHCTDLASRSVLVVSLIFLWPGLPGEQP